MAFSPFSALARACALGAVAGLRSATPPAVLALRAYGKRARVLPLMAAGELVADKVPAAPSRLSPPSLGFRLMTGAASGALLARRLEASGRAGAVLGALGAIAGSYGGYHLRKRLTDAGLPDPVVAVLEDVVATGCAFALVPPRNTR